MSRIGKQPVAITGGAKVRLEGRSIHVEGPKGKLSWEIPGAITASMDAGGAAVSVARQSNAKPHRALHGLSRALIANMVRGVTTGFGKRLEIVGVGYNAKVEGKNLRLQIGFCHPVLLPIPTGLKVETPQPTKISVEGADKQLVGQFAANVRRIRPPEPYNGKGIRYEDEVVRRKVGKSIASS
jgi:large subunit ribosomal protein L6